MNRTDRLLGIILELQAKDWQRAEDLAETFNVSKRTIYRDIQALDESGVPVTSMPGQGYALVEGYFLPPLSFSTDEALILLLGADFMAQNFDAVYRSAAHTAASKNGAVLPEGLRAEVQYLHDNMRFVTSDMGDSPVFSEYLQQIRRAIIQCRTVRFEYHTKHTDEPAGERKVRDADPYSLLHFHGSWYMMAYCYLRKDVRLFRLDRIDSLEVLRRAFARPQNFNLDDHLFRSDRQMIVRALFDHDVARWVREERPVFTIAEENRPDGLLLSLRVRNERELMKWLLGWGRHVRVLEPESLRDLIAAEAEAILQHHEKVESLLP